MPGGAARPRALAPFEADVEVGTCDEALRRHGAGWAPKPGKIHPEVTGAGRASETRETCPSGGSRGLVSPMGPAMRSRALAHLEAEVELQCGRRKRLHSRPAAACVQGGRQKPGKLHPARPPVSAKMQEVHQKTRHMKHFFIAPDITSYLRP